jgi:hypothetical protein
LLTKGIKPEIVGFVTDRLRRQEAMKIVSRCLEQSRLVYYGAVFEIRKKIPAEHDSLASNHNGGENLPA